MSPSLHTITGVLQQEEATAGTNEVNIICGDPGAVCEVHHEWTDSEQLGTATAEHGNAVVTERRVDQAVTA